MKRFLADAILILLLVSIGNYIKEQEDTKSSYSMEQKVDAFEDDIAQNHIVKQQIEATGLNEIKENRASSCAKSSSEFVIDTIHTSVTAFSDIFDSIFG